MTTKPTIVFTNGIFDILHDGHVKLLRYAKSLGDLLYVGINDDWSTSRLKGPTRPIFSESSRRFILESLHCVDQVIVFKTDTPEQLIKELCPDILVKGPEANSAIIPGASHVQSYGGKVVVPDWPVEESTSLIIERVLKSEQPLPQEFKLTVDGQEQKEKHHFTMMFNRRPDGCRPVLYQNGKRVIASWSIQLNHEQAKDLHGRSA